MVCYTAAAVAASRASGHLVSSFSAKLQRPWSFFARSSSTDRFDLHDPTDRLGHIVVILTMGECNNKSQDGCGTARAFTCACAFGLKCVSERHNMKTDDGIDDDNASTSSITSTIATAHHLPPSPPP